MTRASERVKALFDVIIKALIAHSPRVPCATSVGEETDI
jgi:hypothetical protein